MKVSNELNVTEESTKQTSHTNDASKLSQTDLGYYLCNYCNAHSETCSCNNYLSKN
ncbi:hypothetical protein P7M17_01855 [Vibrio parahaemolyticus]|uniref:hypothetical protein n=1 Tax=Vibrio parahaemolyticus TaxID=670 RepID=UPI00273A0B8A|nr:hypothetical protein [Vibrio parahaemolyticus]MDG2754340.1 hypothetical protein [Vibrio parahaemolyticus]